MFNSGHRNFEHFFDFNPDLKSQRGVLMESLEEYKMRQNKLPHFIGIIINSLVQ